MRKYKGSELGILRGHEEFVKQHTRKEVMEEFGVSYNAVNNFCIQAKIKPVSERKRVSLPEGFDEYAKCHTINQIGQHYNLAYVTVLKLCYRHKISYLRVKPKKPFETDKHPNLKRTGEAHEMIKELSKTFTYAAIARVFGYSKERIRQICLEE